MCVCCVCVLMCLRDWTEYTQYHLHWMTLSFLAYRIIRPMIALVITQKSPIVVESVSSLNQQFIAIIFI